MKALELEKNLHQKQWERILEEFSRISEWVSKNFSEVNFQVEFNDDQQNPTDPALRIKTRLITSKAMDRDDQFLRKNELVLRPAVFDDPIVMEKWINNLYPSFTKNISDMVNNWYARKKVEGTAL